MLVNAGVGRQMIKQELNFLTGSYHPEFWYFEILEFFRKMFLTGMLAVIVEPGSVTQAGVGLVACFFFFAYMASS